MRELIVGEDQSGARLDRFLAGYMALAPQSFFYKMLRKKNITVNGKKAEGGLRLAQGDVVTLYLSDETIEGFRRKVTPRRLPEKDCLDVIYEDEHIMLINKPAGMLSQKAKADDVSMVELVIRHMGLTEEQLSSFAPSVCNRLDRNTSGLMTAGKTRQGLREMSQVLRERSCSKYYLCAVAGAVSGSGHLEGYQVKDQAENKVRIYDHPAEGADHVLLYYECEACGRELTLLRVRLVTGKSHQIRAQLADFGHPVAGDHKYGDKDLNRYLYDNCRVRYQLLHSYSMGFGDLSGALSGISGRSFYAPVPENFALALARDGMNRIDENGMLLA